MNTTIEKLVNLGGNEWAKYEKHRVYFNADVLAKIYGLECSYYNTGNISSATVNGEKISNSQAKKLMAGFDCKMYWDAADEKFHFRSGYGDAPLETVAKIRELISK